MFHARHSFTQDPKLIIYDTYKLLARARARGVTENTEGRANGYISSGVDFCNPSFNLRRECDGTRYVLRLLGSTEA